MDASKIKVSQKVVVQIAAGGEYSGTISFINKERMRLQLADVIFSKSKKNCSGTVQLYLSEIKSIEIVSDVPIQDDHQTEDQVKFELSEKHNAWIEGMIKNRVVIGYAGQEFDDAMDDISNHEFVALGVEDDFITVCVNFTAYVFTNIKIIDRRLKQWFESDVHTFIIYDTLTANLLHSEGIRLNRIFNTVTVHRLMKTSTLPAELAEGNCNKIETTDMEASIRKTAILLKFHDFLTENLLKNAYRSFDSNLDYYRRLDSVEFQLIHRNPKSIVQQLSKVPPFQLNVEK